MSPCPAIPARTLNAAPDPQPRSRIVLSGEQSSARIAIRLDRRFVTVIRRAISLPPKPDGLRNCRPMAAQIGDCGTGLLSRRYVAVKSVARHLGQVFLDDQASRFIPDRTLGMRRQRQGMLEDLLRRRIFVLLIEKVAIEVIGVETVRRVFDGLLEQLPGFGLVAEPDREAGHAVIKNPEAGWSAGIQQGRICH